jgi:hypothetical protein
MRNRVLDGGEGADQVDIEGGREFLHGKLLDPGPSAIDAGIGYNYIEPPQVSLCPAESVVLSVLLRGHCLDFWHPSRCASVTRTVTAEGAGCGHEPTEWQVRRPLSWGC